MNWSKKDIVNICKIVAFGVVLYWLLTNISVIGGFFNTIANILKPFIMGIAIAFVINIPMNFFEKKFAKKNKKNKKHIKAEPSKLKRICSILLSLIIIIAVIMVIVYLVVPEVVDVIAEMIAYLPELLTNSKQIISEMAGKHPEVSDMLVTIQANLESINSNLITYLTTFGTTIVTSSFGVISSTVKGVLNIVIAIIFAVYILLGKEKIFRSMKKIVYAIFNEKLANKIYKIGIISKDSFYNFVTGQFTECLILGILCVIGMIIFKIPYAATVGALVTLTAFIPIVGAFIGGFIGVILLLPIAFEKALTFLIFFIILQQIEGNIIYPKVVGDKVGLPGIIVLFAVTVGSAIGGIIGMIICLPITSVLYTLFNEFVDKRSKKIEDIDVI